MKWLTDSIRDYFGFSATELRGFWLLSFLSILLLITIALIKPLFILAKRDVTSKTTNQIDSLIMVLEHTRAEEYDHQFEVSTTEAPTYQLFDPNVASLNVLQKNGIPDWLAQRIVKYRTKGGKFLIKDDLLKIYGFPADLHSKLYSYIQLPVLPKAQLGRKANKRKKSAIYSYSKTNNQHEVKKMNINTVDSIVLQQLSGIGVVFSARIVRFREKLGGFYSLDQLSEIYHITPEVVNTLKNHTYISPDKTVNKININEDEVSTLASHPYISFSLAKAIVKHRENYGNYMTLEDCREVYLMEETLFQKLRPYLTL